MKYATVTVLAPIGDRNGIPPQWFDGMPAHTYYAASIIEEPDGMESAVDMNAIAMKRKIKLDGPPSL